MSQAKPPLPPVVYEWYPHPTTGRHECLYVGMSMNGPHLRFRDHFNNLEPWALDAGCFMWRTLPMGTPRAQVEAVEAARIRELTPLGNREHNWSHYDRLWALRVKRQHYRSVGMRMPGAELRALARAAVADMVRRLARFLAWWLALNVALLILVRIFH